MYQSSEPMATPAPASALNERFLALHEVEYLTSLKKSSLYALADFPRPVRISRRRSAWLASEVHAWMERKASAKRSAS